GIFGLFLNAKHQLRLEFEIRGVAVVADDWRGVAGGGNLKTAFLQIDQQDLHGYELPAEDLRAELSVDFAHAGAGLAGARQVGADEQLCGRHQKSRGHAVTGDVADDDGDPPVRQLEPVVKISADVTGRRVDGGDVDAAQLGRLIGKPVELNFAGLGH